MGKQIWGSSGLGLTNRSGFEARNQTGKRRTREKYAVRLRASQNSRFLRDHASKLAEYGKENAQKAVAVDVLVGLNLNAGGEAQSTVCVWVVARGF